MMTKDAIQYLQESGITPERRLVYFDDTRYLTFDNNGVAKEILPRVFNAKDSISLNTLSGMINYIKSNIERIDKPLILHIKSEKDVSLKGPLEIDGSRELLVNTQAIVPEFKFDTYYNVEEFNIALQSKFVTNEDSNLLLKVVGNVSEDNVKKIGDDGVSQAVTINQGVASKADVKVPNPVELAPYRTFLEVEQPTSQFVFRMKDGPRAAIFEADGGAWRNQAIINIRKYFKEELKEEIANKKITILA